MVRILKDAASGDYVVQTTCLELDSFVSELAEALAQAVGKEDGEMAALGVLSNAMPIAFKLAGYKAENVSEQRTLVCGNISPNACEVVASSGK